MDLDIQKMTDDERIEQLADCFRRMIQLVGDDPSREGLEKTPLRAAKAMWYLMSGYRSDAPSVIKSALFTHSGSQIVIVKDIEFYSMCEHHILPFFGRVSIAYIPSGKIVGLSKLARAVDACARKLQVQENLTSEIMHAVSDAGPTEGVLVICEAQHLCMKMRGVEKQDSSTSTIDYCGRFAVDSSLRAEALERINIS